MVDLGILRKYASMSNPASLPPSVLLSHSPTTLTIFDSYPKATFHFLVLPRVVPPLTAPTLTNLRALLKHDKERAKRVLVDLSEEAARVRALVEAEMVKRYAFKWDIWTGFHAVPSMECVRVSATPIQYITDLRTHINTRNSRHLHLHIISSDLVAAPLKTKRHYNSFHPTRGFFLPLADVLGWFDAAPSEYAAVRARVSGLYLAVWLC